MQGGLDGELSASFSVEFQASLPLKPLIVFSWNPGFSLSPYKITSYKAKRYIFHDNNSAFDYVCFFAGYTAGCKENQVEISTPLMIMEYMCYGDLEGLLESNR